MTRYAIAAMCLALSVPVVAQEAKSPVKGPRIAVEPLAFDFGQTLPQKILTKEFSIRNFGSEDLLIDHVSTSCGCTAALLGQKSKVIKPGASTLLTVTLHTPSVTGRISKTVVIKSNDPARSAYELKVEATIVGPKSPR